MLSRDEAIALASSAGAPLELQEVNTRAGVPQKWFVNGPQTLRELYEQNLTDATFFVYDDERYTFRDSYQLAAKRSGQDSCKKFRFAQILTRYSL